VPDHRRIVVRTEAVAAFVAIVVGLITLNALPVGGFYDDGLYTILAKSLATGHGYRFLNLPGAPPAVHYPPGYPLLLALFWKIVPAFPASVLWFKLLNVALIGVIAWAICRYALRVLTLSPGVAFLATLLGTVTIPFLVLTNMLVSEPLFLAALIPVLIRGEQLSRHEPERRDAIWLGVLSGAVVLIRTIGVMLVIAVALVWLAKRARRAAAWYLGGALVVTSPWLLFSSLHAHAVPPVLQGSYGSYSGWFMGGLHVGGLPFLIATIRVNVARMAAGITASFQYAPSPRIATVTMLALVFMFGYGAWRVRRRAPVTLVFLALYLALVAAWPDQPLRFVWGLWPVLMVLLLVPLEVVMAPTAARPLRVAVALAALCLVPGLLRYNTHGYAGGWWASIPRTMTERAQPAIRWVRANTRPGDVMASESEPMIYLYAEREAVPVMTFTAVQYLRDRTAQENAQALRQILVASHARYALVRSPAELDAARTLAAQPGATLTLTLSDSMPGLYVFTVGPPRPDSTRP
jgi:hypothetical protein